MKTQLLKGGVGSLAVKFTFALLSFLISVVLARYLGAEGFGIYSFATAVILLVSIPAVIGVPELMVRETAKLQAKENWPLLAGLWHWGDKVVIIFSTLVMLVAGLVVFMFFEPATNIKSQTILIGLLIIPLMALVSVKSACVRGMRHVVLAQLPDNIVRTTIFLMLILLAHLYLKSLNPVGVISLYIISIGIACMVSLLILSKVKPAGLRLVETRLYQAAVWRRTVIPLALISGLQVINSYADIIVLGIYSGNDEVGVYRSVIQLSLLVSFGLQALNQVLHPHFSRLYVLGEHQKLQKIVTVSARAILIISLPPVILFFFWGSEILAFIFGEPFFVGGVALAILAVGQLFNASMGSVGALLNMTGHERYTVRGVALAAVTNIVLNVVLIPIYGMVGAAIATGVSLALWNVLLRYYVLKKLNIEPSGLF